MQKQMKRLEAQLRNGIIKKEGYKKEDVPDEYI